MRDRSILPTTLVLALVLGGCGDRTAVVRCGDESRGVEDIVAEAHRPVYDELRNDPGKLVDTIVRNIVVRHALTASDPTPDELRRLAEADRIHARGQCVALGLKRMLARRGDLDELARKRFEADPDAYTLPESFRLQMIFIPSETPGARRLARKILDQVRSDPGAFAQLARRHSRSKTAAEGGVAGPMPGSAVHPAMREAIGQHRDSDEAFLVAIDRGYYVLRILDYWPPLGGTYGENAAAVRKRVGAELLEETSKRISREIGEDHAIVDDDTVFFDPAVRRSRTVMTIDGTPVTAGDILPAMSDDDTVAGPVLRNEAGAYRKVFLAAMYFECPDKAPGEMAPERLAALRIGDALLDVALERMNDSLEDYVELHRDVLRTDPDWLFDLWVFPRTGDDPYRDLRQNAPLIEVLERGENPDPEAVEAAGALAFPGLNLEENRILRYEPRILQALEQLENGETSGPIRSTRLHAFLVVRREAVTETRPFSLSDPEDRRIIARGFVADNRDEVMDAFFEKTAAGCRIDEKLIEQCVARLSEGPGGESREEDPS